MINHYRLIRFILAVAITVSPLVCSAAKQSRSLADTVNYLKIMIENSTGSRSSTRNKTKNSYSASRSGTIFSLTKHSIRLFSVRKTRSETSTKYVESVMRSLGTIKMQQIGKIQLSYYKDGKARVSIICKSRYGQCIQIKYTGSFKANWSQYRWQHESPISSFFNRYVIEVRKNSSHGKATAYRIARSLRHLFKLKGIPLDNSVNNNHY